MNEKIKQHLKTHAEKHGWTATDNDLMEILTESRTVYTELGSKHRWYTDEFKVVEIDGMLIGYNDFHITGDNSRRDMGLDYDLNSVCEVEKKEVTAFQYVKK